MTDMLLALKDVTVFRHGQSRPVLERFSLAVEKGETVIMLGEAESGKDALMRILAGAPEGDETLTGSVRFGLGAEIAINRIAALAVRHAYVPGPFERPLSNVASAGSQLARVIGRRMSVPRASAHAELALALERLNGAPSIETFRKNPAAIAAADLAWGLLAAAIATAPEILLVNHLLASLPPISARAIARALIEEKQRQGFAILYNALGTEVARWFEGRLIVMRHGRIVEEGPASRLTTNQAHVYTQTLLKPAAIPVERNAPRSSARGQPVVQAHALQLKSRDKVTFELRRGGSLALIGEEGSGRHAFARQLIGLEAIRAGRVVFDAVDIGVLSRPMMARMRRHVAMISGDDGVLDPRLSVSDTVAEPLHASLNLPRRLVSGYRDAALKRVGLSSLKSDLPVARLSTFDKRRLQVARAIAGGPIFVLIDEPFRGLDAFAQSVTRDLLKSFRAEEGPAFLVVTSDVAVALALADDAMILEGGRVVERGALDDILRAPQQAFTRRLVEAASPVL